MRLIKAVFCLMLVISLQFYITGCGNGNVRADVVNLSENIKPTAVKRQNLSDDFVAAQQDFALRLFATESKKHQGNLNVSPYSLSFCLSIVAGGAEGDTLSQFEKVLMNGMIKEKWNNNMYNYLHQNKNFLTQADSLWIAKSESDVKERFLQNALGNFNASVYYINFGSDNAVNEVNNWVKEKTEGKIRSVVDELDNNTAMYTADAVYMNLSWATTHRKADVKEEIFTCVNGEKSIVKMMYSTVSADKQTYISDESAEGFIKSCNGGYKFVALMPKEGLDIKEFITFLNGNKLRNIMTSAQKMAVKTGMPYFTVESHIDFKETLMKMGIKNAYNASSADFSGILDNNTLYMGETTQKNCINVDISGIRAASATGQEVVYKSSVPVEEKTVVLNRPFIYIILDKHNIPVFIGTVTLL